MPSPSLKAIRLKGVRQNNLKGFDLNLPLGQLIVVTGLSGSGKSSLVFETLHAEGQRRYVETFSSYTRQFLEMMDRPKVDDIENIRPSIAIEQKNTVKTSRSTVGTMTELCDYFKVWFSREADLHDPATGKILCENTPASVFKDTHKTHPNERVLILFRINLPENLDREEMFQSIQRQGYSRIWLNGKVERLESVTTELADASDILVIQDRLELNSANRTRFLEAINSAFEFGNGSVELKKLSGDTIGIFNRGLRSPETGQTFRPARPNLFSFNSPVGACPRCQGFGRVVEIDPRLVIPDETLSLEEGAIRAFRGEVYRESLADLLRAARKRGLETHKPWRELLAEDQEWVWQGDGNWYGIQGFFDWLDKNTYKMHVRIFLSHYRSYVTCPDCNGKRLCPEAMNWKWMGKTLPDLYDMPVSGLLPWLEGHLREAVDKDADLAMKAILQRLRYLVEVGLGYLSLNRTSRTLSGGEVERVNLTTCLGTSLVDTLFVLDEPSVGLHARDIDRLIGVLKDLTRLGNTVVVVEHDESVIRAADHVIEIGPEPGSNGGRLVFQGPQHKLLKDRKSWTGRYLSGRLQIETPTESRQVGLPSFAPGQRRKAARKRISTPKLSLSGATHHNIENLKAEIPLQRFVCLSGVSGSGKSTLLNNVIHQGLLRHRGQNQEDPATIKSLSWNDVFKDIVLVDQSAVSRTPRSNPVLFVDAWDPIREIFVQTELAKQAGMTISSFSFNSGDGRCDHCQGLGYEKVEMQFLSDVYIPCPVCEGKRFKPEVLNVRWREKSVADILTMDVNTALDLFKDQPKVALRLKLLQDVGLGYLTLGQPLNTLSGGESQRLKLVRYLSKMTGEENALLLLDEPTTGLHRHDVKRLISVLQALVDAGHSLIVIEHQMDVLKSADWIMEMGPGAGKDGGQLIAAGPPAFVMKAKTETSPYLRECIEERLSKRSQTKVEESSKDGYGKKRFSSKTVLSVEGAKEHNLRNINVNFPHGELTVLTGVSGSGKSSLAFDIIFAEGQRRFMESMSAYARQFVEQLPRPAVDRLIGIPPTVSIEQRITRGTSKSTVATITEVAQYLRLLYARIGIQHSPHSGRPVVASSEGDLQKRLSQLLKKPQNKTSPHLLLCAPMVRGRKGHHQPLADWAANHGYTHLRCDGKIVAVDKFTKLDRYVEHDVELVVGDFGKSPLPRLESNPEPSLKNALQLGKGSCFLIEKSGSLTWLSTQRSDPDTGEAFPELDPKHFSWNSAKGWCPDCKGHGIVTDSVLESEDCPPRFNGLSHGTICPTCNGDRLNVLSRAVRLFLKDGSSRSLPELLRLTPDQLLETFETLQLDDRGERIMQDIRPQIAERLKFMGQVGLGYLTLDRATNTLSGGEAQRIRLASQLGTNLSGVLYILDEPSIGLHARDNNELIRALHSLKKKGNSLIVVEHDEDTIQAADHVIELGPAAGIHGGEIVAKGRPSVLKKNKRSLTGRFLREGIPHPLRGEYRKLPPNWSPRRKNSRDEWLVVEDPGLRNLKGGTLTLPKGRLIVVCGVSGAGKSTLIHDVLLPGASTARQENLSRIQPGRAGLPKEAFKSIRNADGFRTIVEVDQNPIGKTPRSTPATYIGAFDIIREAFAQLPEARMRGWNAGTFSFNTPGGRCESCKGAGRVKLEMNFLPDTYIDCEDCGGKRYGAEILNLNWRGKTIADILAMSFEEAAEFFHFHSQLQALLQLMVETGLGYLTLGQSSPTLSGGEAQRLKLVSELSRGLPTFRERNQGTSYQNLYLLEEPTIGLHQNDCQRLLELLHRLVDQGHTVVVIEHHIDVIAEADYVVEIGPGGGEAGGQILYQGPVESFRDIPNSPTAPFLM